MKPYKVKLIAPSPPFGTAGCRREQAPTAAWMRRQQSLLSVTLSPARERKLHLASENKKTSHKAQVYKNSKLAVNDKI